MRLAEVVIDIPTKALDDSFTYSVPSSSEFEALEVGCAVQVQFGGRPAIGFVVALSQSDATDGLREVDAVLSTSFFDEFGAECARFLAKRYIAPLSTCIRLFTPPGAVPSMVRTKDGGWQIRRPQVGQVDDRWVVPGPELDVFEPRKGAAKQAAIIDVLKQGEIKASELSLMLGGVSQALGALEEKGVLKIEHRRRIRGADNAQVAAMDRNQAGNASIEKVGNASSDKIGNASNNQAGNASSDQEPISSYRMTSLSPKLTEGQMSALESFEEAYSEHSGRVLLVDGVTGSGKTEVYLQAIWHALQEGKSAIMLVPEISLTPQTVARFRGRFGDAVAVLHSKMGAGERFDQWELIREGRAKVVIGPRSALFAPLQNLGIVVIDEEHESTYKQESAPRYVVRDVAVWMMRKCGGTLVLGSATPSIDSLYRAHTRDDWSIAEMPERVNGRPMPEVQIVDMSLDFKSGGRRTFSTKLKNAIVEELSAGHKVVLLLNQRGFARFMLCNDCGFVPQCTNCSTTLTYHSKGNRLVCHHCGYSVRAPRECPSCGSPYLEKSGIGTQRVESELNALLDAEFGEMPAIPSMANAVPEVIRMDADTTSRKGSHRRLLEKFAEAPRAVLLGTQMIAKGLDFDEVTLVGVVNADVQLHLPDFRAEERTFDLIEQVAGRAGRADLPGRVMVQTYEADNIAITAAAAYDREAFLRSELPKRRILGYPPFVRMANVLVWGSREADVEKHASYIQRALQERVQAFCLADFEVLPANPCVLSKVRNDFRWHILLKCPNGKDISAFLADTYASLKPAKGVNVAIDVDPYDLL